MFTGLIEKVANIANREINGSAGKLTLQLETPFENVVKGESIAINGVCLTVETFSKTNLGTITIGGKVNLERALAMGDRLGGHMVSGHVDSTSEVLAWNPVGDDWELVIAIPESIKPYLVEKGSIAIDGVSLTIAKLYADSFAVHLIPTTLADTALFERQAGAKINLEADIIGKYVLKQLIAYKGDSESNITMNTLLDAGW